MNYKNYLSYRKVTMSSQEQDLENGKKVTTSKVKQFTVFTLSYYSKYYIGNMYKLDIVYRCNSIINVKQMNTYKCISM